MHGIIYPQSKWELKEDSLMRVYADNAATTKLSPAAKEAMLPYFDEIYGNPSTLYTLGQEAAEHLLACRTEICLLYTSDAADD